MNLIILFLAFSLIFTVNIAHASLSEAIGIADSKNCINMLKHNFTTNCPGIPDLLKLNLDNSNTKISGGFKKIDGIVQRDKPLLVNHYQIYRYDRTPQLFFIDPPSDMRDRIKMIIIESHFDTYLLDTQMFKANDTRTISKDRYIDSSCRNAIIGADNWRILLPDTITFMQHKCDESFTKIKTLKKISDNRTNTDISTSQKYQLEKWQKEVKISHKVSKIGNDKTINKSVTEDKDPKYKPKIHPPFNYGIK